MHLTRIHVRGLRCLVDAELMPHARLNLITGLNGAGKSSLLEAIHLLAYGRSFRGRVRDGLISTGAPAVEVYVEWVEQGRPRRAGLRHSGVRWEARLDGEPLHLIIGMLANKDVDALLSPFAGRIAHIHALPVPGHEHHPPERFAATAARWGIGYTTHAVPEDAIATIATQSPPPRNLLIGGSLYLAGEILRLNAQIPD